MRTIGYFDDTAGLGGTTRYLLTLLRGLDRARYRPIFFAPTPRPWHHTLLDMGVEVITGPGEAQSSTAIQPRPRQLSLNYVRPTAPRGLHALKATIGWHLGLRGEIAAIAAVLRRRPVDLLHTNNTGEEAAPIAARRAGVQRVVGTLHVDPGYDLFGEHREARHIRLQRKSMKALDVAIAVSQRTGDDWRRHLSLSAEGTPRIEVIPNGIASGELVRRRPAAEAKVGLGLPVDSVVLGTIGRLDHAKGYGDLLAALPSVLSAFPQTRVVHAGTGALAEALRAEAARLGVEAQVHWLGFQSDIRDVLEAVDLYVQPSWCEAQGLAVLEAGALGIPVVASSVGGLPESLDAGNAGWLVPPRNPAALADILVRVLGNRDEMSVRGDRLARRVHTVYTTEAMVNATLACYEHLFRGGLTQ